LPIFQGRCDGVSFLSAGIILAIMVVPFITAISREVLLTVPSELKTASLALGATKWETIWKVVLPQARVGIGGGVVLALGRALGETMAVTMVIGNTPEITASLLRPGHSMSAVIANEFREATDPLYLSALVEVGLLLFILALIINVAARVLLWRMRSEAHR
jgi:phosphate transport system permease protein